MTSFPPFIPRFLEKIKNVVNETADIVLRK